MKKIIFMFCIMFFILNGSLLYANSDIGEYIYFPSGSFANTGGNSLEKVHFASDSYSSYSEGLYEILFSDELFFDSPYGEYKNDLNRSEHHRKLFIAIFLRENNKYIIEEHENLELASQLQLQIKTLEKEVELARLRYDSKSNAQSDYEEIYRRLTPVMDLYFKHGDHQPSQLGYSQERFCGQFLQYIFNFQTEKNTFPKMEKYYIISKNYNRETGSPWVKMQSRAKIIFEEDDLLELDKKQFLIHEISPKYIDTIHEIVELTPGDIEYINNHELHVKELTQLGSKKKKAFEELSFVLNHELLLNYWKGVGIYENQDYMYLNEEKTIEKTKMSFTLVGIDEDGQVIVISQPSNNLTFEANYSLTPQLLQESCKNFGIEPEYRLITTKINGILEKIESSYNFTTLVQDQEYNDSSYPYIDSPSRFGLKKLQNSYNNLSRSLATISERLESSIQAEFDNGLDYIFANQKSIEKLIHKQSLVHIVDHRLKRVSNTIGYWLNAKQ